LGLLKNDEYDYDALADAPQHVPCLPPPQEEEEKEVEVPVEEYMPPSISEEEAIQMAIEDSELSPWEGSACSCMPRPTAMWWCHHCHCQSHQRLHRQHTGDMQYGSHHRMLWHSKQASDMRCGSYRRMLLHNQQAGATHRGSHSTRLLRHRQEAGPQATRRGSHSTS
jgi:hypothetical protein